MRKLILLILLIALLPACGAPKSPIVPGKYTSPITPDTERDLILELSPNGKATLVIVSTGKGHATLSGTWRAEDVQLSLTFDKRDGNPIQESLVLIQDNQQLVPISYDPLTWGRDVPSLSLKVDERCQGNSPLVRRLCNAMPGFLFSSDLADSLPSEDIFTELAKSLGPTLALTALALGMILVIWGRRIYWLLVGIIGFIIGIFVAPLVIEMLAPNLDYAISTVLVIIGAFIIAALAVGFHRALIVFAGMLGVGSAAFLLMADFSNPVRLVVTIVGAALGAGLIIWLFEWGLVITTTLVGAMLVTSGMMALFVVLDNLSWVIFAICALLGLLTQGRELTKEM